jgi:glutamate--cysteine ligase
LKKNKNTSNVNSATQMPSKQAWYSKINFINLICKHKLQNQLMEGRFGIEKESFRVQKNGHLALTAHPKAFAEHSNHPFITTDLFESRIEMITPICNSTKEAIEFIETLQDIVNQELKDEYLWPYSQPPILPDDEEQMLLSQKNRGIFEQYYKYVSKKYGNYFHSVCGVHFNFSLTSPFIEQLYQFSNTSVDFQAFKNHIYMKMARFYIKHTWLITYLTGMGNIVHSTFFSQRKLSAPDYSTIAHDSLIKPYACSFRNSTCGYQNLKYFKVSYDSLDAYVDDLKFAIEKQYIAHPREYYSTIRIKGKSKNSSVEEIRKEGVDYLEIRNLDLVPNIASGIDQNILDFLHLFLIYGLLVDETAFLELDYRLAFENQLIVANAGLNPNINLYQDLGMKKNLHFCANELLANMHQCFTTIGLSEQIVGRIFESSKCYQQVLQGVKEQGYIGYFLSLAKQNHLKSLERTLQLRHYEDLELSTQALLKECIKQGIHFHFLDRKDNFFELQNANVKQFIKQATKTQLDNYSSILCMENKLVAKTLMARAGINVCDGKSYIDMKTAFDAYCDFCDKDIVIKPNQTNYGTAITILKRPYTTEAFKQAIDYAFQFDKRILIEYFFEGKEYRFLVINYEVIAVLHLEAANVIGNGRDSIEELVRQKNLHPMRGEGQKTPLEKIKLGDVEQQFLKKQHLDIHSIVPKGEKIFLRGNSNISTGGDSIDFTDVMPDSYKKLAIKATQSASAIICGVDMIIQDIHQLPTNSNYCLIELKFNPAIYMHIFPYVGEDRKIAKKILETLKLIPNLKR